MKKLIFIGVPQYGYQIDYYNYCKYLGNKYDITYICIDQGRAKIKENGANVIYLDKEYKKSKIKFTIKCSKIISEIHPNLVFINNYFGAPLLLLISKIKSEKFVLDIRSMSVSKNYFKRLIIDMRTKIQSRIFTNLTVVSDGIKKKHFQNYKNCWIVPVGTQSITKPSNIFQKNKELNLIYVGTLNGRNITQTVEGVDKFLKRRSEIDLKYRIIGYGDDRAIKELESTIYELGLKQKVNYLGYIENEKLERYMLKSDLGVSYIPLTSYYEYQPPTKTFEYLQFGLPVIATSTYENEKIINEDNGVLISDNSDSFSEGIEKILDKSKMYSAIKIKHSSENFTWENIVREMDKKILSVLI